MVSNSVNSASSEQARIKGKEKLNLLLAGGKVLQTPQPPAQCPPVHPSSVGSRPCLMLSFNDLTKYLQTETVWGKRERGGVRNENPSQDFFFLFYILNSLWYVGTICTISVLYSRKKYSNLKYCV